MNLSRIILLIILLIASDINSQNKQDLEKQKRQIQNDIKKIELKLSNSSKQKDLIIKNLDLKKNSVLNQDLKPILEISLNNLGTLITLTSLSYTIGSSA